MVTYNVSVVGATGIVGKEFLKLLEETKFQVGNLRLFGGTKSEGEKIPFRNQSIVVEKLTPGCFQNTHVAFFSAGTGISQEWAPKAVQDGCFVIDNSSAFRMDPEITLVVPEVNAAVIPNSKTPQIIANPNCSTIQLVIALKPLEDAFGLEEVIVSTYQSVSGAGRDGIEELERQTSAHLKNQPITPNGVFHHPIAFNNLPQIDLFDESGFTLEELKVINETKKIMGLPHLKVSATAVRTPTFNGHSEAVWITLKKDISRRDIIKALTEAPGLVIQDKPQRNIYPHNREASGQNPVFVGRIRQDLANPRRWLCWIVADNVRKGAALNGLQIAEKLFGLSLEYS